MNPISREAIIDRRQPHIRWSSIFAGTILSIGLWILLQTLGMGLGLTAVDTDDAGSLRGAGIGTGIWSLLAPLIAIFVGAFLAGRLAGTREPKVGAMHGSVLWALTSALGLYMVISVLSAITGTVSRIGGAAASATGSIVSGAVSAGDRGGKGAMSALGIDTNDLLGPVNKQLRDQGKPPVTANQLEATLKSVARRGLREGQLDRQVLVDEVARNTALSRADSEQVAAQIEQRYQSASQQIEDKVSEFGDDAKDAALVAADKTGKGLLGAGVMLLLGLGAALGGGALGAHRAGRPSKDRERDLRRGTTVPTNVDVVPGPTFTSTTGSVIVDDPATRRY